MAKQYLTRANLIDGGVSPISSPNVQVPIKNIALAGEADLFGSLAQRLDSFSQVAFKAAGQEAERQGMKFGIDNAPTLEEVEAAKLLGKPVEISGDYSSGQIFQQAAYKGSMAVTETHYSTAARKALMEVVIDNAESTPEIFSQRVSAVVTEYSQALAQLDPASAAKLQSSLGIVANGNVLQHSRSFALKQKKELRESAIVGADQMKNSIPDLIEGFQYNAATPEITLDSIINAEKEQAINKMKNADVGKLKIQEFSEQFDEQITSGKITYIRKMVRNLDNPDGRREQSLVYDVARKLRDGKYEDRNVQYAFDSLKTADDRSKAQAEILREGNLAEQTRIGDQKEKEDLLESAREATRLSIQNKIMNKEISRSKAMELVENSNLTSFGSGSKDTFYKLIDAIYKQSNEKLSTEEQEIVSRKFNDIVTKIEDDKYSLKQVRDMASINKELLPVTGNDGLNWNQLIKIAKTQETSELKAINDQVKMITDRAKPAFYASDNVLNLTNADRAGQRLFQQFKVDLMQRVSDEYEETKLRDQVLEKYDPSSKLVNNLMEVYLSRRPSLSQQIKRMTKGEQTGSQLNANRFTNIDSEKELRAIKSHYKTLTDKTVKMANKFLHERYGMTLLKNPKVDEVKTFIESRFNF